MLNYQLPFTGMSRLALALLLAGTLCIVLDFLIVRWVWRKANKGLEPFQPDNTFTVTGAIPATPGKQHQHSYTQADQQKTGAVSVGSGEGPAQYEIPGADVTQVNPMEKHILVVAVLNLVFGTIGILGGIIALIAISGGGVISGDPTAMKITGIVGLAVGFFFFLTSVPGVIGGIGLLKRRGWARILLMIIAVLGLMNIPIGTAVGIYTLWVLMNEKTAQLFAQAAVERNKEINL
jgi:hypothetical protein